MEAEATEDMEAITDRILEAMEAALEARLACLVLVEALRAAQVVSEEREEDKTVK
jgi:hypothetical protein